MDQASLRQNIYWPSILIFKITFSFFHHTPLAPKWEMIMAGYIA